MIFEVDIKHVPTITQEQAVVVPPVEPPTEVVQAGPRKVIIDTDWWTDVDDAVAMRLAAYMERLGQIDIIGVALNAMQWNSASSLDECFCNEGIYNIPIGVGPFVPHFYGKRPPYQRACIQEFVERSISTLNQCDPSLTMYRKAIAAAVEAGEKIDIISIGFLTNIAQLLQSGADDYSQLSGLELVEAGVKTIWIVGGHYPTVAKWDYTVEPPKINAEYNMRGDYAASKIVCETSPVQLAFLGSAEGQTIKTGQTLNYDDGTGAVGNGDGVPIQYYQNDFLGVAMANHSIVDGVPQYDPAKLSPTWYFGNSSWDPLMLMIACYGDPYLYGFKIEYGTNVIDDYDAFGHNTFTAGDNPTNSFRVINNRWVGQSLLIDPIGWEKDMNSILERRAWPPFREEANQNRLARKAPSTSPTDHANLLMNLNMDDYAGYLESETATGVPIVEEIHKMCSTVGNDLHLVRWQADQVVDIGTFDDSPTLDFSSRTTEDQVDFGFRYVSTPVSGQEEFLFQPNMTFYFKIMVTSETSAFLRTLISQVAHPSTSLIFAIRLSNTGNVQVLKYNGTSAYTNRLVVTSPSAVIPNVWQTIAVRFSSDGGNTIKVWLNGQTATGANFDPAANRQKLSIGTYCSAFIGPTDNSTKQQFDGHISKIRIYETDHDDATVTQIISEL